MAVAGSLVGQVVIEQETQVISLSRGGMTVVLPHPLATGSVHDFSLVIEGARIELRGAVKGSAPLSDGTGAHRVGIEFEDPASSARAALDCFLGRRLQTRAPGLS